jgi:hypothetical protein
MSESNNLKSFNIESILNEISGVIHTGLNNILDEFMEKYNDYEANYNAVLNLPAVKNKISSLSINNNNSVNSNLNNNIMSSMYKTFNSQMKELQKENEELKAEIYVLKSRLPPVIDLTSETETETKKPIIIKQEPENITLVIEEQPNEEVASSDVSLEDESLEDAESDASLDEEESVASLEEELVANEVEEEEEEEEKEEEESVASLEEEKEEEEESVAKEVEEEEESVANEVEEEEEEEEEDDAKSVETETKEEVEEEDKVEEEEELFEIEIDDKTYCTNNEESGFIYELDSDGNVGDKIGYFKESEPIFYSEE